jgi:hypothetical protein
LEYCFRNCAILFTFDQDLDCALGKGDFAGEAHQVLVHDAATYPGGLKQVLEVMRVNQVVRGENRFHFVLLRLSGRCLARPELLEFCRANEVVFGNAAD